MGIKLLTYLGVSLGTPLYRKHVLPQHVARSHAVDCWLFGSLQNYGERIAINADLYDSTLPLADLAGVHDE